MTYNEKLEAAKEHYPFAEWREMEEDLEQYTEENCNAAKAILDTLITGLQSAGEAAPVEQKVALFKTAVESLNTLNAEIEDLIETGEREDLCTLFDEIATAAGLNPAHYGGGEGIASEWREW